VVDAAYEARYRLLKALQQRRLSETYADLAAQDAHRAAAAFFFESVYNTDDTTRRDAAFIAFTDRLRRVLGGEVVACMDTVIALQKLTISLDEALLPELVALNAPLKPPIALYEQAYARMGRYDDRLRQIRLTVHCIQVAWRLFHRIGIGTGLKALHQFMRLRGDTLVTGFLMEGYHALHRLRSPAPLADAVQERETQRLERIFATYGSQNPEA